MKKDKKYKYNAFISYRHTDPDKFVAENLHRLIETYKMPEAVVQEHGIDDNNIRRVFRDEEELPLSPSLESPIIEALKESEFLIVICSPRLKESLWCRKEIETFIEMHDRNHVLCVLVEGTPEESFPEEVLYHEEKYKDKNGKTKTKKVYTEPLALNVIASNKKERYKKLKSELIRVMAPLYNLNYDDIKRRHEERELKRKARLFKIIAIASIVFAIYSFSLFSKIYITSKELKKDQSINLAREAGLLYNKDDRVGAIKKAYQSITEYNGIKMPVTPEGLYNLTSTLGVYDINSSTYKAESQLETLGVIKHIKTNPNEEYLLSYDQSGELILWDLNTKKKIKTVSSIQNDEDTIFIGNKAYAYFDSKYNLVINNLKGKELKKIKTKEYYSDITASKDGKYFAISNEEMLDIYDTKDYSLIYSYKATKGKKIKSNIYFDEKEENILFIISNEDSKDTDNNIDFLTFNIKDKNVISSIHLDAYTVEDIVFNKDNAVIIANKQIEAFSFDASVISYNYLTGTKNYEKKYSGKIGTSLSSTTSKDSDPTVLFTTGGSLEMFDLKTGTKKYSFENRAERLYVRASNGTYLVFTNEGDVYWIKDTDNEKSLVPNMANAGYFFLSLDNYKNFLHTKAGYLGYASLDNRIIVYNKLGNKDYKKTEYKEKEFKTISYSEENKIKEKFKFEKEDLINKFIYSKDKKILFVIYKHGLLEVYDTKTKEKLNTKDYNINKDTDIFVAKTKDNEYIIKNNGGGYILDKDFNLIAYVPNLYDYKDGYLIINDSKEYYKIPKYSKDDIIKKAKEFLEKS